MKVRLAVWSALPFLLTLGGGGRLWSWLWGRWFSPGGEFLYGCIHLALVAGCLVFLLRPERHTRKTAHLPSLLIAVFFMFAAAFLYSRIPTLTVAGLYVSALYWAFRASPACGPEKPVFALWPLLLLSLPVAPSLQFVFGYPLRALAAKAATLLLPATVKAVGCGIGDGRVEVFVDAPCAGAGMLISALFLAAGVSLVCRLNWWRTGVMLVFGVACALSANSVRAAILYLGNAGLILFPLHRYEEATGLFCFTANALILVALAVFLSKSGLKMRADAVDLSTRSNLLPDVDITPKNAALGPPPTSLTAKSLAIKAAHGLSCAVFILFLQATVHGSTPVMLLEEIVWPKSWGGNAIVPCEQSPEMMKFWSGFPGAYHEFTVVSSGAAEKSGAAVPERIVMRLVTQPTRLLHPAQDCFRGSGFSITPLPAYLDQNNRLWSGFIAEKNGRKRVVRQCVIAVGGFDLERAEEAVAARVWPDVSSWYWDVARPGSGIAPLALAVTVIAASE